MTYIPTSNMLLDIESNPVSMVPATIQGDHPSSKLLDLPAELRIMVWRYVLAPANNAIYEARAVTDSTGDCTRTAWLNLSNDSRSLLLVNKRISKEACNTWFEMSRFSLSNDLVLNRSISTGVRQSIRHLHLQTDQLWSFPCNLSIPFLNELTSSDTAVLSLTDFPVLTRLSVDHTMLIPRLPEFDGGSEADLVRLIYMTKSFKFDLNIIGRELRTKKTLFTAQLDTREGSVSFNWQPKATRAEAVEQSLVSTLHLQQSQPPSRQTLARRSKRNVLNVLVSENPPIPLFTDSCIQPWAPALKTEALELIEERGIIEPVMRERFGNCWAQRFPHSLGM